MGLTRTRFIQANTALAKIQDPITVLNSESTVANIDVGFLINRDSGLSANSVIYWSEAGSEFVTALTANTGIPDANIVVSSYANLKLGSVFGNIGGGNDQANVYITGSLIPSSNVEYDLGTSTNRFRSIWVSGNTIYIGRESISVDGSGTWSFSSGNMIINIGENVPFNSPSMTTGNLTVTSIFDASTIIASNVTVTSNLTIQGTQFIANTTDVAFVDSKIELHTLPNLAPLTSDDGRDIGFKFHYYKTEDEHAFLGWRNSTGYLEWFDSGREGVGNVFTGNTYGTIKSGGLILANTTTSTSATTGALQVAGGVGIAGNLYVNNVGDVSANVGAIIAFVDVLDANIGSFQIYANANLSTQTENISNITSTANTNTAAYISTYTGNIGAGNVSVVSNVFADRLFTNTGLYWYGNGATFSSSPGGASGQIQYNNAGSFDGSQLLFYAGSGNLVATATTVSTSINTGGLVLKGGLGVNGNIFAGGLNGTLYGSLFIGTTDINYNRSSGSQTLTGVGIDGTAATATNAINTQITSNISSGTAYITFVNATTGNVEQNVNTSLTYNPNSGNLRAYGIQTDTGIYWASNGAAFTSFANADVKTYLESLSNVNIGLNAGISQGQYATAVGNGAGSINQGDYATAIGPESGFSDQAAYGTALGFGAGSNNQSSYAIAVGYNAGQILQKQYAVAVGYSAGQTSQGVGTVAIGEGAGSLDQKETAVAIGSSAGNDTQGNTAVAVGYYAGQTTQGINAVAIGGLAGQTNQGIQAIAIGAAAGQTNQGNNAVAIGLGAGYLNQTANSIVISANGILNSTTESFYVDPIRNASSSNVLYYNTTTKEITFDTAPVSYSNTNVAAYLLEQNITSANIGTLFLGNNSTNANLGAFYNYANTKIGTNSNSNLVVVSTENSTSATTGALVVAGGLGVGANVTFAGNTTSAGKLIITEDTDALPYVMGSGAFHVAGGISIGKDLWVGGNIWVNNVISQTSTILQVSEPLVYLFPNSASYNYDIGAFSEIPVGGIPKYTGIVRSVQSGEWVFFSNIANQPTSGSVGITEANVIYDPVKVGNLVVSNTTISSSTTTGALIVRGGAGITGNVYADAFYTTNGIYWSGNGASYSSGGGGSYGNVELTANLSTGFTASIVPAANLTYSLGSATAWWDTFYGISTQARYADLAENYQADDNYDPGTVLCFGGPSEVTISTVSHDTAVAGVVSTNPAHLMNGALNGSNVIPLALQGRVPCLVKGPVNKGTVVVTSNIAGVAQALDMRHYQPGCVIGKSLDIIPDDSIQKIEVVVGRC